MGRPPVLSHQEADSHYALNRSLDPLRSTNAANRFADATKKMDMFSNENSSTHIGHPVLSYHEAKTGRALNGNVNQLMPSYAANHTADALEKMDLFSGDKYSTETGKTPSLSYHEADTGFTLNRHTEKIRPTYKVHQPETAQKEIYMYYGQKLSNKTGNPPILRYHEADTGYSQIGHVDKFRFTYAANLPVAERKKMDVFPGDKSSNIKVKYPIFSYHKADTSYSQIGHFDKVRTPRASFKTPYAANRPQTAGKTLKSSKIAKKRSYSIAIMERIGKSLRSYWGAVKKVKASIDKSSVKNKAAVGKNKKSRKTSNDVGRKKHIVKTAIGNKNENSVILK